VNLRSGLAALLLAAGVFGVAGCEPAQIGAAAVVDGQTIPISDIQRNVKAVQAYQAQVGVTTEAPNELARRELVRRLLLAVHERAAEQMGVTATGGEVSEEVASWRSKLGTEERFEQFIASSDLTPELFDDWIRQAVLRQKMGEVLMPGAETPEERAAQDAKVVPRLSAAAKAMDIDVNPRFGDFNKNRGQLLPHVDDFIEPAEEPEPGQLPGAPAPPGGQR
jgi:hypothetical protein